MADLDISLRKLLSVSNKEYQLLKVQTLVYIREEEK